MADPVTLAEAKAHLRVTSNSEDGVIQGALDAATQHVESITGVILEPRQVVEAFSTWGSLRLRSWPVQSIFSVERRDMSGFFNPVDSLYQLAETHSRPARLTLARPTMPVDWGEGAIQVTVNAGYASPSEVPAALRQAILIATGHFYRDREGAGAMPAAVDALCRPHRLMTL